MKPSILLVDDNEEIIEFLRDDLSEKYCIKSAVNGKQALDILNEEVIDLVVSDIMMPVMDGFQLCKSIKSKVEISHIPVILLTAKNTMRAKIEGLELGADAYIEKPFSPEFLQVRIANLLNNRIRIRSYFARSPLVHIKTMAHSKADEEFLTKLNEVIGEHIQSPGLDVDLLAKHMHISRPTLYRKIKLISDVTPNELINITRLKKGAELLNEGQLKIYEIAELTGYSSVTNFGRSFLKQFNFTPSDYINLKQDEREQLKKINDDE